MIDSDFENLGHRIAGLRYRQQLKQSELACDAGVSLRTLQRLESGEIVKTDVLLKVLQRLGRLDALFGALTPAELSPYELLEQAGLQSTDLGKRKAVTALDRSRSGQSQGSGSRNHKRRVRRPVSKMSSRNRSAAAPQKVSTFQWPEDQVS